MNLTKSHGDDLFHIIHSFTQEDKIDRWPTSFHTYMLIRYFLRGQLCKNKEQGCGKAIVSIDESIVLHDFHHDDILGL